jgi:hypothetical protein
MKELYEHDYSRHHMRASVEFVYKRKTSKSQFATKLQKNGALCNNGRLVGGSFSGMNLPSVLSSEEGSKLHKCHHNNLNNVEKNITDDT